MNIRNTIGAIVVLGILMFFTYQFLKVAGDMFDDLSFKVMMDNTQ